MEVLEFYAVATLVTAIPLSLIFLAARLAHRVCHNHSWPKKIALAFAVTYAAVALIPYSIFGAYWGSAWFILTIPFSLILEIAAPIGFVVFVAITTITCTLFWATLLYSIAAIILLVRKKRVLT